MSFRGPVDDDFVRVPSMSAPTVDQQAELAGQPADAGAQARTTEQSLAVPAEVVEDKRKRIELKSRLLELANVKTLHFSIFFDKF